MDYAQLPEGTWVTVAKAAKLLGVSKQTVRKRYLLSRMRAIKHNNIIYVEVSYGGS